MGLLLRDPVLSCPVLSSHVLCCTVPYVDANFLLGLTAGIICWWPLFFVCCSGPAPCFLMKRHCAHAFFQHFSEQMLVYLPPFYMCKKPENNCFSEMLALLYTNHTNLSSFFHVRAAKSWPGYSDCIIAKSHHGSPPQTGGPAGGPKKYEKISIVTRANRVLL